MLGKNFDVSSHDQHVVRLTKQRVFNNMTMSYPVMPCVAVATTDSRCQPLAAALPAVTSRRTRYRYQPLSATVAAVCYRYQPLPGPVSDSFTLSLLMSLMAMRSFMMSLSPTSLLLARDRGSHSFV
jgi:hypothetical protein